MRPFSLAIVLGALALGTLLPASAALADDDDVTRYDFTDELVRGDLVRPDVEVLEARRRRPTATLIRVREHFIPELYKSVEQL